MQIPLQIVLDPHVPPEARGQIEAAAETLEHFHDRITSCRVAVSTPDHRHHEGEIYEVHMTVRIPGHREIVVSHKPGNKHEREHLHVAIARAFHEARRQLQDAAREKRGDVKTHEAPAHGRISKLFAGDGYGFITMGDGQDVYFHRNSLINGNFEALSVGADVRFTPEAGENGTQASSVTLIGKHHIV